MDTTQLENRIQVLEQQMQSHFHSGHGDRQVNLLDILGKFEVVSTAPAGKPSSISGQIKIYTSGSTYRLYWYDTTAGTWHYVTATA